MPATIAAPPPFISRIGEFAGMRQVSKRRAGIGVTAVLAGATFAVAVISGVFLLYDSRPSLRAGFPLDFPAPQSSTETARPVPPHTDHRHGKVQHMAHIQRFRHVKRA